MQRILREAVDVFARETRFDVAFGGLERAGVTMLSAISGAANDANEGVLVRTDQGLGGRALRERRPRIAADYVASRQITHEYDAHIRGERIVGLFAMPVLVDGEARAVLYGGTRGSMMPGTNFARIAAGVARDLSRELSIEDEVARRIKVRGGARASDWTSDRSQLLPLPPHLPHVPHLPHLPPATVETLRTVHAGLRGAIAEAPTPRMRERLLDVERQLTGLSAAPLAPGHHARVRVPVQLSPREIDTLTQVALGATNAEIGEMLGLTENTIKSYLNAAMTKLDASTRHAAVSRARSLGFLV